MKRVWPIVTSAMVASCNVQEPAFSDAEMVQLRAQYPGMTKGCFEQMRRTGFPPSTDDPEECFRMTPAKRWTGLWNAGWEWSNFCPAPAEHCPIAADHGDIWLEFKPGAHEGPELRDGLYAIEFIGRRTAQSGSFGHLNQYDHLMAVDRVISIRKVPDKRKE